MGYILKNQYGYITFDFPLDELSFFDSESKEKATQFNTYSEALLYAEKITTKYEQYPIIKILKYPL